MNAFPSEKDIQQVLSLLVDYYKVPKAIIKGMFGEQNYHKLNKLLEALGEEQIDTRELAKMLIMERGAYLFSGSGDNIRELREYLLRQLSKEELVELYNRNPASGKTIKSPSYMVRPLVQKKVENRGRLA